MAVKSSQPHSLKVIGCGFGRTGTMTLKSVLEDLGFGPCYHGTEVFANRFQVDEWMNIAKTADKRQVDWSQRMFANPKCNRVYYSSVDWPTAQYYRYLHEFYPNAKFILTVRDAETWYMSMIRTIIPAPLTYFPSLSDWLFVLMMRVSILCDPFSVKLIKMQDLCYANEFGGMWHFHDNKERAVEHFKQHIEDVKRFVDKDRLFIIDWTRIDEKQMYQELCAFLGVEYQGQCFPHLNERNAMRQLMREKAIESALKSLFLRTLILCLVFAFALYVLWRRYNTK